MPADAAALAAELDRYRALYEQDRADRIMLQQRTERKLKWATW